MKTTKLLILTCALSLNTVFAQENMENDSNFPRLENPFFGQKPPGSIPEIFAPRIVSTEHRVRYLDDGRLQIDNNGAENAIRPFVLGRNYPQFVVMGMFP